MYVGCGDSSIFTQLLEECSSLCPPAKTFDQFGGPVCFANYNSSYKYYNSLYIIIIMCILLFILK
jgi:hypothetical protein